MILGGVVLVLAWYLLRFAGPRWAPAGRLVRRIEPYTARLHRWVLSAPATFCYVAVFTAFTLVQRTAPPGLVDLMTKLASTNLRNLGTAPVEALLESALWVADRGAGLALYVLVFGTVVAWAERRYGTPRIILICLTGHVLGSFLTSRVELWAIRSDKASATLAFTTDVGVSYMMVAGCGAALLLLRGRLLAAGGALLGLGVVLPLVIDPTIWDLGHLLATLCGLGMAAVTLAFAPPRTPLTSEEAAPSPV